MKREMILPVLLSFGISLALGPVLIPFLRKVKAGQKEREEGVPSHQKKAGTPTMGGVMFLAAFTAVSLLFRKEGAEVVPVLFLTLGFGLIGFLDDYLKVVLHRSRRAVPEAENGTAGSDYSSLSVVFGAFFRNFPPDAHSVPSRQRAGRRDFYDSVSRLCDSWNGQRCQLYRRP